jgi:hypothetical protein
LIAEQMKLGREAAEKDKWGEAAKAAAKILKMDPDHAAAQELKRIVFWGPLPEKTSGDLKYKEHPTEPVCVISGVVDEDVETVVLPTQIKGWLARVFCRGQHGCGPLGLSQLWRRDWCSGPWADRKRQRACRRGMTGNLRKREIHEYGIPACDGTLLWRSLVGPWRRDLSRETR